MHSATTTLALVGPPHEDTLRALESVASNIGVEIALARDDESLMGSWKRARSRSAIYTVVNFDPLQRLVDRWAESLDSGDPIIPDGGIVALPDYYLIDPSLAEPLRSWYLQLLFDYAPQRIITIEATVEDLYRTVSDLPYGAALPTSRELEEAASRFVPTPGLHAVFASGL